MFKLRRYFSVASALAILAAMASTVFFYHRDSVGALIRAGQDENVNAAHMLSNVLSDGFDPVLEELVHDQAALLQHPATADLTDLATRLIKGTPIVDVRLYDAHGYVLHATDPALLGADPGGRDEVTRVLAERKPLSRLINRGQTEPPGTTASLHHVVATWVPLSLTPREARADGATGRGVYVLAIRSDVTTLVDAVDASTLRMGGLLMIVFGGLYLGLLVIVSRADTILRGQQSELMQSRESIRAKTNALEAEIGERERVETELRRNLRDQEILASLLAITQQTIPLATMMERALKLVLTSHGLGLEARGSIFIADPENRILHMMTQQGLHEKLLADCRDIAYGRCLCGRAAAAGETIFADRVDHRHEVAFPGMAPHGHYCLPLKNDDDVVGVLNLYVPEHYQRRPSEERFLTMVADTLAGIIRHERVEEAIRQREENLRNLVENAGDAILVHGFDGRILSVNERACHDLLFDRDELLSMRVPEIHARFDASQTLDMWVRMKPGEPATVETEYRRKDGSTYPVEVRLGYYQTGRQPLIVAIAHDLTVRKEAERRIRHMATHDNLTGLPNRSLFMDRVQVAITNARRHRNIAALLFIDLDGFKSVNDTLGHDAGDALLRQVAGRLATVTRGNDTVARHGGDEFTVVLGDLAEPTAVAVVAEKIIGAVGSPYLLNDVEARVGCSIGIALFPRDGETADTLLKAADAAMYEVKHAGKNAYRFAVPAMRLTPA